MKIISNEAKFHRSAFAMAEFYIVISILAIVAVISWSIFKDYQKYKSQSRHATEVLPSDSAAK